jgi:uncharacterized protein (DUF305 family)
MEKGWHNQYEEQVLILAFLLHHEQALEFPPLSLSNLNEPRMLKAMFSISEKISQERDAMFNCTRAKYWFQHGMHLA